MIETGSTRFVKVRAGLTRWQSDDQDVDNGQGPMLAIAAGFNLQLTDALYFHFEANQTHYYLQSNQFSNRRLINNHYALGISYVVNREDE